MAKKLDHSTNLFYVLSEKTSDGKMVIQVSLVMCVRDRDQKICSNITNSHKDDWKLEDRSFLSRINAKFQIKKPENNEGRLYMLNFSSNATLLNKKFNTP